MNDKIDPESYEYRKSVLERSARTAPYDRAPYNQHGRTDWRAAAYFWVPVSVVGGGFLWAVQQSWWPF